MEKITFAGLEMNKISLKDLLFNKTILLGYLLLMLACVGIYEIFDVRYFSAAANAHASGLNPTDPALKEAMRLAITSTFSAVSVPETTISGLGI